MTIQNNWFSSEGDFSFYLKQLGLIIVLLFFYLRVFSQSNIQMLNGKEIYCLDYKVGEEYVFYKYPGKRGEIKDGKLEKERIFSITSKEGVRKILYSPDTITPQILSVPDMEIFIQGERDAIHYYNPRLPVITGLAGGIIGGVLAQSLGVLVPAIPALFVIGTGLTRISYKGAKDTLLANKMYKAGYRRVAKSYNVQQSLKYSFIGLGIGLSYCYREEIINVFE